MGNMEKSSRRIWLALILYFFSIHETQSNKDDTKRPNVLFVVVDDLRASLGCYGEPILKTPNLDNLASKSIVFEQTFAQQALCGPSRISFLTSRRPDTTRFYDFHSFWRLDAGNYTTLPQHFKENGYITQNVGKVFHPGYASNHTDDAYYSWTDTPYHPPTQKFKNAKVCPSKKQPPGRNVLCPVDVKTMPGGTLPDIQSANYAVKYLKNLSSSKPDKPFFLAVGFHKPHLPLKFPKKYLSLYPNHEIGMAEYNTFPWRLPLVAWNPYIDLRDRDDVKIMNLKFPFGAIPNYFQRLIRQSYYAATSYMDAQVGKVLEALEEGGFAENTIVAFIGDHGWSLGEHGVWTKYSLFEVAVRVPFIMYVPGLTYTKTDKKEKLFPYYDFFDKNNNPAQEDEPTNDQVSSNEDGNHTVFSNIVNNTWVFTPRYKSSDLVELVDVFPTLAEAAGLPTLPVCPEDSFNTWFCTEGASLMPLVKKIVRDNTDEFVDTSYLNDGSENRYIVREVDDENPNVKHSLKVLHYKAKSCSQNFTAAKSENPWKSAVFSQYPRPSVEPKHNTELPHLADIRIMGYSMWTPDFHYTEWVKFHPENFTIEWEEVYGRELYLRITDPHEIDNVAMLDRCFPLVGALSKKLKAGWRKALPK